MVNLESVNEKINGNFSHQIIEKKRNFDLFREESIYLFGINVYQGIGMRRIEWQHLGLKPETIESLKENKASTPSLTVFNGLKEKASKLNSMRARIQRRYMVYSQPYWFIKECDLENAADEIQEMRSQFTQFQNELLENYDVEREDYLLKVGKILQSTGVEGTDLERALTHYVIYFPSKEKVMADFRLEFTGPVRIPSIKEQSEQDAQLAETENRIQSANILQQLQLEYANNVRAKFNEAVDEAKDEIYAILAEQLTKLEEVGNKRINKRIKNSLENALDRISILTGYDESLAEISKSFGAIAFSAKVNQRSQMLERIAELRQKLSDEVNLISNEKQGHKALAQWII